MEKKPVKSRLWKWIRRIVLTLIVLIVLLIYVVLPWFATGFITQSGTRPGERDFTFTPMDSGGVAFEDVVFRAADPEVHNNESIAPDISAWYLPHDSAKAVIIYSHGLFRSRREVLNLACTLWEQGFAGLILDLRGHGESPADLTSMGYLERYDIVGASKFLREDLTPDLPIIAYGVSMGGAATLLATSESNEIDMTIVDSSFLSFEHTIRHHAKFLPYIPSWPIATLVINIAESRIGFDRDDFDLRKTVAQIDEKPILFIAAERDQRMPIEVAQTLHDAALTLHKSLVIIPDATHGRGFRTHPNLYIENILNFVDEHLHH